LKKILITVIILLLTAIAISYAGFFKAKNETYGTTGLFYENPVNNHERTTTANSVEFLRAETLVIPAIARIAAEV
jgi:uncharacterized protein YxeA